MPDKKVGIISGYFDPLHAGHIEYMKLARNYCDHLHCIVNNDKQALLKKGFSALSETDRLTIVSSIRYVDAVSISIDEDLTVQASLVDLAYNDYENSQIIFLKGGDRFASEIPESIVCKIFGITIIDGLGDKIDSSSRINNATIKANITQ